MRIVWLSHFVPYPPTSGALERSYHLLRHVACRHEVHLLAFEQRRLSAGGSPLAERIAALRGFCRSVEVGTIPAEASPLHRTLTMGLSVLGPVPGDQAWLRSRAMHRSAGSLAARMQPTLLHVDTIGLIGYARHFRGVPVLLNHHNVESALVGRRADRETSAWRAALLRREARKRARAEQRVCPNVAMNIVVSPLDGERLNAIALGSHICVVENGVDTSYFTPGADPGAEGGLVFAGTLGWFANRDAARFLASEILPILNATPPVRGLTLVGRDPQRGDWGDASRVTATGYVDDVRPYIRRACIYVCPIREGGGTRLKVLAALAMGKPLVATSLAVEGLRLVDGEHYLRAELAPEFAARIRRLEDDPALRQRLGAAGRALVVREYDWSVVGRQMDAACAAAVGGGTAW